MFCFLVFLSVTAPAQKTISDTATSLTTKELELSDDQLIAIKKIIVEYKNEERIRRYGLRNRILAILNIHQQMMIRHWWRNKRRGTLLPPGK